MRFMNTTSDSTFPALLEKKLFMVDWSMQCFDCFVEAKIHTVGKLVSMTAIELFAIEGFGLACLAEVRRNLASIGLKLNGD